MFIEQLNEQKDTTEMIELTEVELTENVDPAKIKSTKDLEGLLKRATPGKVWVKDKSNNNRGAVVNFMKVSGGGIVLEFEAY